METVELRIRMTGEELKEAAKRYHFQEEDFPLWDALYQGILPLLQVKAYYKWGERRVQIPYEEYAVVFVTLGDGVDALQNVYLERQCLSEAYIIECVSLAVLEKAYGEFVKQLQKKTGKWAEKIDFLGDTYPIEMLPDLYQGFGAMDITYNESLVLLPAKSVAFLLPMSVERHEGACNICIHCRNKKCIFRREPER